MPRTTAGRALGNRTPENLDRVVSGAGTDEIGIQDYTPFYPFLRIRTMVDDKNSIRRICRGYDRSIRFNCSLRRIDEEEIRESITFNQTTMEFIEIDNCTRN